MCTFSFLQVLSHYPKYAEKEILAETYCIHIIRPVIKFDIKHPAHVQFVVVSIITYFTELYNRERLKVGERVSLVSLTLLGAISDLEFNLH